MAQGTPPPVPERRPSKTQVFARFITRNRFPVAMFLIFSSLFFFYPILNTVFEACGFGAEEAPRATSVLASVPRKSGRTVKGGAVRGGFRSSR